MNYTYETIKVERDQSILWIILNRPQQLNAINITLIRELSNVIDKTNNDTAVRCIVIVGKGDKAFSVGGDLTMLSDLTPAKAQEIARAGQKAFRKIEEKSKPVIAAINGFALGGGLELALACDIRVAAEHAELGFPEITLGLIPAWGGTQRLAQVVGLVKAKEMIMLGEKIKADEAFRIGLVHRVVPFSNLREEVTGIALKICRLPPIALLCAKRALNFRAKISFDKEFRLENNFLGLLASTEDAKEGVGAFLAKRKAVFKG